MCSRCSSSRSWYTASSNPPGRTESSNAPTAASPAALGSAGYCIETRSNEPNRERHLHGVPPDPLDGNPGKIRCRLCAAQRHLGDVDRGHCPTTTSKPDRVGALATTDIEHIARREATDLGDEPAIRSAAPQRAVSLAVPRVPVVRLRRRTEQHLALLVLSHVLQRSRRRPAVGRRTSTPHAPQVVSRPMPRRRPTSHLATR